MVGLIQFTKGKRCYEFDVGGYCNKSVMIGLGTGQPLSLAQVEVLGTGEKGNNMSMMTQFLNFNDL